MFVICEEDHLYFIFWSGLLSSSLDIPLLIRDKDHPTNRPAKYWKPLLIVTVDISDDCRMKLCFLVLAGVSDISKPISLRIGAEHVLDICRVLEARLSKQLSVSPTCLNSMDWSWMAETIDPCK